MLKFSRLFLACAVVFSTAVIAEQVTTQEFITEKSDLADESIIPCPFGFSAQLNPSVPNSICYKDESSSLAISVTAIKQDITSPASPESYAKTAAKQMSCSVPVLSNIVSDGWSFDCPSESVEGIVYGDDEELVLLAITGRNRDNEVKLEQFINFLDDEAKNQ